MTTTTDQPVYQNLLVDICRHPDDDSLRLILADWLEDQGEPERARFVAEAVRNPATEFVELTRWNPFPLLGIGAGLPSSSATWGWGNSDEWGDMVHDLGRELWYQVDRGLIVLARCKLDAWLEHGPELVRLHPVVEVRVTDREPFASTDTPVVYYWFRNTVGNWPDNIRNVLDTELWDAVHENRQPIQFFDSSAAAMTALSRGCVNLARQQARLELLTWRDSEVTG